MELTLTKPKESRIKCNTENYFCVQIEIEYLGFWVTRKGIQTLNKKVEKITNTTPITSKKVVRKFIGLVKYHCGIWKNRSHILQALTRLTSKNVKF